MIGKSTLECLTRKTGMRSCRYIREECLIEAEVEPDTELESNETADIMAETETETDDAVLEREKKEKVNRYLQYLAERTQGFVVQTCWPLYRKLPCAASERTCLILTLI